MLTLQQVAVGPPPLPGGVAAVLRFFFNLPQWFQIVGFIVGVIVAAIVLVLLWRRRAAIVAWIVSRPRGLKISLAAGVAAVALGFAAFGVVGWDYMQHNNGFCTGCHVMKVPFQRFAGSKHDSLSCHDCHQQGMYANVRQLYLWVAERPEKIGKHAKVPTRICATCHVRGDAKQTWQRIASTAGHRTHLESDSSALKNVQCVTCHGLEVHHFVPVDSTCAQAGCHVNVRITLAKMSNQTDAHCVTCHQFTAEVPLLATRDSARGTLVPRFKQCFSCHQMQAILADFDPARDPHRGTCGFCHNPHVQKQPAEAARTCASAKCHADWRDAFHAGKNHAAVAQNCILCHEPHHAKLDASDCAGCHAAVKQRRGGKRLNPPLPFDTAAALRRVSARPWVDPGLAPGVSYAPRKNKGDGPFFDDPPPGGAPRGGDVAATDTFPHARHKALSCITCHTSRSQRSRLTFQPPRGCQICHHQAPKTSDCAVCHRPAQLMAPESVTVQVTVSGRPRRDHSARFDHVAHRALQCVVCHTTPVTLDPDPKTAACAACHDDHQARGRRCAACHDGDTPEVRAAHAPPLEAHVACDACHAATIVAGLVPDRGLCVSCHGQQVDHYPARECTVCHFGTTPEALRPRLLKRAAPS
ncbi:MAG TPA: hypothetical protein VN964_11400 [Gemmatimonadales bacterium]|nr:hypothetical protein [Gemmatimonadales bacterium]